MSNAKTATRSAPNLVPRVLPLKQATIYLGMSRSAVYRAAADGRIRLLKIGRSTVLDVESGDRFLAGLPEAPIGKRSEAA